MMQYTVDDGFDDCSLAKARRDDAGYDLKAAMDLDILAGERLLVPTAVRTAIPLGCVGLICPRSGLALKYGLSVLNAPGVIDSGYRGEIGVILINHGKETFTISRGDRIAQLVVIPTISTPFTKTASLDDTERGEEGFGSSGISKIVH